MLFGFPTQNEKWVVNLQTGGKAAGKVGKHKATARGVDVGVTSALGRILGDWGGKGPVLEKKREQL